MVRDLEYALEQSGVPKHCELEPDYLLAKRDGNCAAEYLLIGLQSRNRWRPSRYYLSHNGLEHWSAWIHAAQGPLHVLIKSL